jgi:hypothetical protein
MAIGAIKRDILRPVIKPVAVFVVNVKHEGAAQPFTSDGASFRLTPVFPPRFQKGPSQDMSLLSSSGLTQDKNLLPRSSEAPSVILAVVGSLSQKMGRINAKFLESP